MDSKRPRPSGNVQDYMCNCKKYCHGVWTCLSRSTYYNHKKRRLKAIEFVPVSLGILESCQLCDFGYFVRNRPALILSLRIPCPGPKKWFALSIDVPKKVTSRCNLDQRIFHPAATGSCIIRIFRKHVSSHQCLHLESWLI